MVSYHVQMERKDAAGWITIFNGDCKTLREARRKFKACRQRFAKSFMLREVPLRIIRRLEEVIE